ncbi:hypothetical protein [Williamsia serinedens]|uniref:Uncharacterized protein n=1 Tax=Williamsia serinedens TaxID=391736 RepID=A0ABT1GZI6_9NOCA|nr:hypothetical protein [Williamsia serinedens]MCP2159927.1 hypothetical protein [Williamsia serinedens]
MTRPDSTWPGGSSWGRLAPEHRAAIGTVLLLALATCLLIVALPMVGSLVIGAAVVAGFAGAGAATLYVLSRD